MTVISYQQFVDTAIREYNLPFRKRPFSDTVKFHRSLYFNTIYQASKTSNYFSTVDSEVLGELTIEQALILLYKSAVLHEPLDRGLQLLKVGDAVCSPFGVRGTIVDITKKGYVKLKVFGTNRLRTTAPDSLFKISIERDYTI